MSPAFGHTFSLKEIVDFKSESSDWKIEKMKKAALYYRD